MKHPGFRLVASNVHGGRGTMCVGVVGLKPVTGVADVLCVWCVSLQEKAPAGGRVGHARRSPAPRSGRTTPRKHLRGGAGLDDESVDGDAYSVANPREHGDGGIVMVGSRPLGSEYGGRAGSSSSLQALAPVDAGRWESPSARPGPSSSMHLYVGAAMRPAQSALMSRVPLFWPLPPALIYRVPLFWPLPPPVHDLGYTSLSMCTLSGQLCVLKLRAHPELVLCASHGAGWRVAGACRCGTRTR